jgi:hypothetical protein
MVMRSSALARITQAVLVATLVFTLTTCSRTYESTPISLAYSPGFQPPTALETGAYAAIAVTVSNDPKNAGVTFSCTPDQSAGDCGSFSLTTVPSTVPTCYLAPDAVPSGGTVTVTATSVTDPTKMLSSTITIENGAPNPCP